MAVSSSSDGSAVAASTVVPSDSTIFAKATRALYIGVTGNLTVTMLDGNDQVFENVPVGVMPIRCSKVKVATTATKIVAMF